VKDPKEEGIRGGRSPFPLERAMDEEWKKERLRQLKLRKLQSGKQDNFGPISASASGPFGGHVALSRSKTRGVGRGSVAVTTARARTLRGAGLVDPAVEIANAINEALDPTTANGKVRTLNEMTEDEKLKLATSLGAKIAPPPEKMVSPTSSAKSPNEPTKIEGVLCRHTTEKAMLFSYHGREQWVPRYFLETNIKDAGGTGWIIIPHWVAVDKGFVVSDASTAFEVRSDLLNQLHKLMFKLENESVQETDDQHSDEFYRGVKIGKAMAVNELRDLLKRFDRTPKTEIR
jgi:hypothetical protein